LDVKDETIRIVRSDRQLSPSFHLQKSLVLSYQRSFVVGIGKI
jgi:hypothetical protein